MSSHRSTRSQCADVMTCKSLGALTEKSNVVSTSPRSTHGNQHAGRLDAPGHKKYDSSAAIPIALSSVSYSISITISFSVVADVDSPFAAPRARASIFSPLTGAITTSLECSSPSKLLSDSKYVRTSFARLNASLGAVFVPIVGLLVFVFVARHSTPGARRIPSITRQSPRSRLLSSRRRIASHRIVCIVRIARRRRRRRRFASRVSHRLSRTTRSSTPRREPARPRTRRPRPRTSASSCREARVSCASRRRRCADASLCARRFVDSSRQSARPRRVIIASSSRVDARARESASA